MVAPLELELVLACGEAAIDELTIVAVTITKCTEKRIQRIIKRARTPLIGTHRQCKCLLCARARPMACNCFDNAINSLAGKLVTAAILAAALD